MLPILFYSFLAGIATLGGCLIVISFGKPGEKLLAWMLGFAAGIMLTVVIIDLLPSSYSYSNFVITLLGFIVGNFLLFILDIVIAWIIPLKKLNNFNLNSYYLKMGSLIAIGIALHDLPEGIAIAVGYTAAAKLGLIIALAIGLHNIPEGMATAAPLKMSGMKNQHIFLLIFLVSFITPLGAYIGYILVSISKSFVGLLLANAGGAMTYIIKTELWPESHRRHPNYARLGAFCGVFLMLLASLISH